MIGSWLWLAILLLLILEVSFLLSRTRRAHVSFALPHTDKCPARCGE